MEAPGKTASLALPNRPHGTSMIRNADLHTNRASSPVRQIPSPASEPGVSMRLRQPLEYAVTDAIFPVGIR